MANVDGTDQSYPLGENATGVLTYTAEGHMSVQVCAPGRPHYSDGKLHGGTGVERAAASAGYIAYAGAYSVDGDTVTHHTYISLFPNGVDIDVRRRAILQADELTLEFLEPVIEKGTSRTGALVWRRVHSKG